MGTVSISQIRIDGGTQTRAGIREDVVEEYAGILAGGGHLPPATVFDDGTDLWMADGFHRRQAYLLAGKTEMPVEIKSGAKRDALLYSVSANTTHGLRRSNEDKRKAIRMLLVEEEWSHASDRWIAAQCHVSEHTVAGVRAELTAQMRSCRQKTEGNGNNQDHDNGKRLGKDGKERPAGKPPSSQEDGRENDEIVDDDDFPVPARLREIFDDERKFRAAEAALTKAGTCVKVCEESKAYKQTEPTQTRDVPSSVLFTIATRFKDRRPSIVCRTCNGSGDGCATCGGRGWLSSGERANGK